MSATVVDPIAVKIAQKLSVIRTAEREKVVSQNKLESLLEEVDVEKERLNRLDSIITSTKYQITHCINDSQELSVVGE
jgi:hypothetical protein